MYICYIDHEYLFNLYDAKQNEKEEREEKCFNCYEILPDTYLAIADENYCIDCGAEHFDLYDEDGLADYLGCIRYQ